MRRYSAFNCTVIGQRYIEKEKPCEDYSLSYNDETTHIAVVADGHGDPRCFRSNVGSQKACEVTLEELKRFSVALQEEDAEQQLFTRSGIRKLTDNLFRSIVSKWTQEVLADITENPATEEEYASVDAECAAIYRSGRELVHIYGTTLIAMLMTDRYMLVLHQGDGRCVVLHHDGTIDQPVPWDPRCVGRNTASLCDSDVLANWRYHLIDLRQDPLIACYAVSDGIEDSFETMDELNAYLGRHAADYVTKGAENYLKELPSHFAELTRDCSRDDISMGCIIDSQAVSEYVDYYRLNYEYYLAVAQKRSAVDRIKSMKRKTEYLSAEVARAQAAFDSVCSEEEENLRQYSGLQRMIMLLTNKIDDNKTSKKLAERDLIVAKAEYNDYLALRKTFIDRAKQAQKEMDDVRSRMEQTISENYHEDPYKGLESFVYTQPLNADDSWEDETAQTVMPGAESVQKEEPAEGSHITDVAAVGSEPNGRPDEETAANEAAEEPHITDVVAIGSEPNGKLVEETAANEAESSSSSEDVVREPDTSQ